MPLSLILDLQMNTLKSSVLSSYDPCKDHRCRKGVCSSKKDGKNYTCRCQAGWAGKYCDEGNYRTEYSHPISRLEVTAMLYLQIGVRQGVTTLSQDTIRLGWIFYITTGTAMSYLMR